MKISKQEQNDAIARLREWVKPGDTVYCILRHVSKSGMSRSIALYIIDKETCTPRWITRYAQYALGSAWDDKHEAIKVGGCGMDMGFALVYELAHALYPDGFGVLSDPHPKTGDRARAQLGPENAKKLRAIGYTFFGRNGDTSGWDTDGGYALKHSWL